jgi:ADP-ribose pyrophosphatase YjhB (NUDIX family)
MLQKYKVFIESSYIFFTETDQNLPNWPFERPHSYEELASRVQKRNFQVVSADPKLAMFSFFTDFKFVQTAGGLVQRGQEDAFLWMYRFEHLDLPKGKIEKGEGVLQAAIREIQEETGLTGQFELREQLPNTYHVYPFKNRSVFKENHWFRFQFFGEAALHPQTEEGIEAVFWLKNQEWRGRLEQTYPGLKELLETAC